MAVNVPPSLPMRLRQQAAASELQRVLSSARPRLLITVTVLGSAGPLRFLVDEGAPVSSVIADALKCYAREGRWPALGSRADEFVLYCANGGSDALSPADRVSFNGYRSFVLCKKQPDEGGASAEPEAAAAAAPGGSSQRSGWKAGFNKLLSFKM